MSLLMSSIVILGGGSGMGSDVDVVGVVGTGSGSGGRVVVTVIGGADITSLVGAFVTVGTFADLALRVLGLTAFGLSSAVSI
jgi:hypothetical protein